MSVPLTLLGLLEREPSHGYDLKRDYDSYFGRGRPLPYGQVYATLARLARDGKAVAGEAEPGSGPDRKRYAITPAGTAEVETWLAEPSEPEPHLQTVLFAKVVLALMLGRPAEHYLDVQRGAHLRRMRELTEAQAGRPADRHAAGRLRAVPSGSRPALDRHDDGQARRAGGIGTCLMNSPLNSLIWARGVVKSFGQTPALRGADVQVTAGEILAVMGPSGSGKSTLLHCLAGIFPPDEGEISFDGQRLDQIDETRRTELRRTAFGFVFQFGQLVPELTAADNVALPLLLGRVRRKAAYQAAGQWLTRLGLEDKGGRRTGELSGGEAQRVAVARALAVGPEGPVRRRADRIAGLADRGEGNGPADRPGPGTGRDRGAGHPRRPGRRLRRPPGPGAGRPGRPRWNASGTRGGLR